MFLDEYFTKRKLVKDFLISHKLPKYTPQGQMLEWEISVYKDGEYDIYTGEQKDFKYQISVTQKYIPGGMSDVRVYRYNVETDKAEPIPGCIWG